MGVKNVGQLHVLERGPQHIRTRIVGRFDRRLGQELLGLLEEWSQGKKHLVAFHDASEVVDYDVAARDELVAWVRLRHGRFDVAHLLVECRTIAWVVQIVAAVSGGKISTHHTRASYEAAFQAVASARM